MTAVEFECIIQSIIYDKTIRSVLAMEGALSLTFSIDLHLSLLTPFSLFASPASPLFLLRVYHEVIVSYLLVGRKLCTCLRNRCGSFETASKDAGGGGRYDVEAHFAEYVCCTPNAEASNASSSLWITADAKTAIGTCSDKRPRTFSNESTAFSYEPATLPYESAADSSGSRTD